MKVSGIYPVFTSADIEREVKGYETSSNKITEMRAPHNDAMYIVVQHVKD